MTQTQVADVAETCVVCQSRAPEILSTGATRLSTDLSMHTF